MLLFTSFVPKKQNYPAFLFDNMSIIRSSSDKSAYGKITFPLPFTDEDIFTLKPRLCLRLFSISATSEFVFFLVLVLVSLLFCTSYSTSRTLKPLSTIFLAKASACSSPTNGRACPAVSLLSRIICCTLAGRVKSLKVLAI